MDNISWINAILMILLVCGVVFVLMLLFIANRKSRKSKGMDAQEYKMYNNVMGHIEYIGRSMGESEKNILTALNNDNRVWSETYREKIEREKHNG